MLIIVIITNSWVVNGDHLSAVIVNKWLVGGNTYPSEKYEFVSWDDDIPNIWEK